MKRFFIIALFTASAFFTSAYATGTNTAPAAQASFHDAFYGATEVTWSNAGALAKAAFVLNGQHRTAFYTEEGELVAVTQNLTSAKLPKSLQAGLKQHLQGRWITNAFVVFMNGSKNYYVALENAGTTVVLKSGGSKKWAVFQTTEK